MKRSISILTLVALLTLFVLAGCGATASEAVTSATSEPPVTATARAEVAPTMRQSQDVTFRKTNDWGSGFTGEISFTNTTGQPISDWQIGFRMPATIQSIWNAKLLAATGEYQSLNAESYNRTVQPGETVKVGFNASPGGSTVQVTELSVSWPEISPPAAGAADGRVTYHVTNDWGSGFGAQVTIENPDNTSTQDWSLKLSLSANITQIWGARIVSHQGNQYEIVPESWNQRIEPHNSVSFGFNGDPGGTASTLQSSALTLSSTSQSDPTPQPSPDPTPQPSPDPTPQPNPDPAPAPSPQPPAAGFYSASGSQLVDSQGHVVLLNGINWFGMETETYAPHGLWTRSMASMLDQMKSLGYTTLRVPYSNEALRPQSVASGIDFSKNPELAGKTPLEILDILVREAGKRDVKILLDRHRPDSRSQSDLWYTPSVSEEQWIQDWEMLARRYRNNPTVIGADLHNEPHGRATWGPGDLTTDWRLAAQRAGNRILAANPDWLIVVEGIESYDGNNYWWGGNLSGARNYPVNLSHPHKLVYSSHDYPASVYNQPWFSAPDYPANLRGIWESRWGYLLSENIAPVLLGEFGTKYQTQVDRLWLHELTSYLLEKKASFTYWCWNPNSADTGGILKADWNSVEQDKQQALSTLVNR